MIEDDSIQVGYASSRDGWTLRQEQSVRRVLDMLKPFIVIHGGGLKGDAQFDALCKEREIPRRVYPANNLPPHLVMKVRSRMEDGDEIEVMTASPAPGRNLFIIRDAHVMIACPNCDAAPVSLRGQGTWHTVRHTREALKPLFLIPPSGCIIEERMQVVHEYLKRMRPRPKLKKPRLKLRTDL